MSDTAAIIEDNVGDKDSILKVLPPDTYAQTLLLRVQRRLLKLAYKHYVQMKDL